MKSFKEWLNESKQETTVKIKVVSGHDIRQNKCVDFIGGGHYYVYKMIPKNEIWIEDIKPKVEQQYLLVHELTERMLMRYHSFAYEKAHNIANSLEKRVRKGEDTEKIFEEFISKHFKNDAEKLKELLDNYSSF